jgi:hypothetical protein
MAILTVASFGVVLRAAADEPYFTFHASDCLVQVGVASVLILLWVEFAAFVVWSVVQRRLAAWWLTILVWVVIVLFYLSYSPRGYVEDMARFGGRAPNITAHP